MGNIKNFNFNKLDVLLSNSDYWDFYLANDESSLHKAEDCLVSYFDFNNPAIFNSGTSLNLISSLATWTGATNTGYTFNTIGLTGIDNGLVTFDKHSGDTANLALLSALTGTSLLIPSGDSRLHLNSVTGTTNQFIYPINLNSDFSGQYAQFNGGFYQGYYQIDGSTYKVLPTRVPQAWVAEFWLKKDDTITSAYTGTRLNDIYPNNKGFFFYMGTRAENKFWNAFEGADTGCTSGCTVNSGCTDTLSPWCTVLKESNLLIGTDGFNNSGDTITLYPNQVDTVTYTNQFLLYGQVNNSKTTSYCSNCGGPSGFATEIACFNDGIPVTITTPKTVQTNFTNPFLIYGQVNNSKTTSYCSNCGGPSGFGTQVACGFSGFDTSIQFDNLPYTADTYDNAIGFRIRDDGSIGYRLLTITGYCSGTTTISGYTVEEGYSPSGMVQSNVWTNIIIRYSMYDTYEYCDIEQNKPARLGRLSFYVNGKLKYFIDNFKEFIARRLNDYSIKQVGVPFNISLGGGSQGLIETQTFDGRDTADLGLNIEQNFAGSFIGDISQFKFNLCDLYFDDITNIYNSEVVRYTPTIGLLSQENGYLLLQENLYSILI
jgi:hypothetical protein